MPGQLRTVVADDEPLALDLLCVSLDASNMADVVRRCRNGREVLAAVRELEPDLLVLDVEMPGMTGFDVVRALQADTMPLVIFVTAFSQYAVNAFDINAVDYVLKPIDDYRLEMALKRARNRFEKSTEEQPPGNKGGVVDAFMRINKNRTVSQWQPDRRLAVREGSQTELLDYTQIVWIDAAGDYMCLHDTHDNTHLIRSTMNDLLLSLNDARFARVHRSTTINLDWIQSAESLQKGEFRLTMQGGGIVKVSRNYREVVHGYFSRMAV